MLFKNVVGQQPIKQKLVDLVAHNRLSHALLFLGKEGSGVLPLALAFANYVSLNPNPMQAPMPDMFGSVEPHKVPTTIEEADAFMEANKSFGKVSQLSHPDIHYTYPVITKKPGEKPISTDFIKEWREFVHEQPYGNVYDWLQFIKAENKQGNITANECSEIVRKLSLKSFESDYKILIVWMPEFLGKEGNRLLKLIEEPPPDTLFILVAESEEQIISTILSRTQLIKVPLPDDEEIVQYLRQKITVVQAMQITAACDGNVREALQMMQHSDENWLTLVKDGLNALLALGPVGMTKWALTMAELGREKQKQFLKYYLQLVEYAIKASVVGINSVNMPDAEKELCEKLIRKVSAEGLEVMGNLINDQIYAIERNANAKILFHALIIRLYHIIANNNVILV
jgi:DNA polymerase III subunit delta'